MLRKRPLTEEELFARVEKLGGCCRSLVTGAACGPPPFTPEQRR